MDLDKLKELCDRATPGPWHVGHLGHDNEYADIDAANGINVGTIGDIPDQSFVCAAREAMPELIERISKLEAALRWYADRNNYVVQITLDEKLKPIRSFNPMSDGGQRARDALGILK